MASLKLTDITKIYLEKNGFTNIEFAERDIPIKRIPQVTSVVDLKPVDSMIKEYIIVHKRAQASGNISSLETQ